ncbi:MAG: cysteine--tRNA ligase [Candidatus Dasytiphilus stammeri]
MLKIYNTLSHKKERFKPINSNEISMYVCGVTVYDLCHIGHGRTFMIFDIIVRYLRYCGYKVKYVRNITDIDDKIIQRALDNKESIEQLTNRMIFQMHRDFAALNLLSPDIEPRATHHIEEIINFIKNLLIQKYAYISSNGDILFDINSYPFYGHLSRQNITQLKFKTNLIKHNPMDFILWKKSYNNQIGWNSPWGKGRPGWHIECSAMNSKYLGQPFDIHGGGIDLIFPHHENEIAQSSCINNKYVNYWIHSGIVFIENEKMSKSLNNVLTIQEALKYHNSETLRYFMIANHYRSPLIYSEIGIKQAHIALTRLYKALLINTIKDSNNSDQSIIDIDHFDKQFQLAMDDDFNTPQAFAVLFHLVRKIEFYKNQKKLNIVNNLCLRLRHLAGILGLLQQDPNIFLQNQKYDNIDINLIKALIIKRNYFRKHHKWKNADIIRDKLRSMGIIIEDGIHGTNWRYKKTYENGF